MVECFAESKRLWKNLVLQRSPAPLNRGPSIGSNYFNRGNFLWFSEEEKQMQITYE